MTSIKHLGPRLAIGKTGFILLTSLLAACSSLEQYSTDVPAMVLAPIAATGSHDRRAQFRKIFCDAAKRDGVPSYDDCSDWLHRLSDEPEVAEHGRNTGSASKFELLIVPGIFGECVQQVVTILGDATAHLRRLGYKTSIVPIRGRGSSELNAKIIRDYVNQAVNENQSRRFMIIAYSKGVSDTLVAIEAYPELRSHVSALISVAGVVNGSPIADDLNSLYGDTIGKLALGKCPVTDHGEIQSLTRSERLNWLANHTLPTEVRYFSLVAMPDPGRVSAVLRPFHSRLSSVDPRNDGQVIYFDAVIPNGVLLGYANADHWAIALPFEIDAPQLAETLVNHNHFPRPQLLEAAVKVAEQQLLEER